jgi:hypothetical protein
MTYQLKDAETGRGDEVLSRDLCAVNIDVRKGEGY